MPEGQIESRGRKASMKSRISWNRVASSNLGSDPTAAGGGNREESEWQRSADEEGALSPTKMPGTATG